MAVVAADGGDGRQRYRVIDDDSSCATIAAATVNSAMARCRIGRSSTGDAIRRSSTTRWIQIRLEGHGYRSRVSGTYLEASARHFGEIFAIV
ncbi:hypothetical protein Syun_001899 [Stephania yunnanensis]|uniref:Uncharacterized protein n=1 Tax=Stephania yunnanensis TaxID=152371 RepID=A0AAP0LKH0_9MAGN